jgi:hypothetical protein
MTRNIADTESSNISTELIKEITRVRDVVLPPHADFAHEGDIALSMLNSDLHDATIALSSGNVVDMAVAYEKLKKWRL